MDREYMEKHNLMEAHKQFMRLSEGYLAASLTEDDDENQKNGSDNPAFDNNPGNQAQQQDMQQPMDNFGQDGHMDNGGPDDDEQEQGLDNGFNNQGGGINDELPADDELDSDIDDNVLDIEDLTQAQEKLNQKQNSLGHDLGQVDDRISTLLTAIEKIQGSLEKNSNDISSLKSELEKRVPTDTEKLNMQSLNMYPYNVSPNKYWEEKVKEGRYEANPNEEKEEEYKITQDDVDNYSSSEIEKSFDDGIRKTMKDIFKDF